MRKSRILSIVVTLFLFSVCIAAIFLLSEEGENTTGSSITNIAVSPGLDQIAIITLNHQDSINELGIFEINNNLYRSIYTIECGDISSLSWSPDSKIIAFKENIRTEREIEGYISLMNVRILL